MDFVRFPSDSATASDTFFQEAFGWTPTDYGPGYTDVAGAGVGLGFQADPEERPSAPLAAIRTDDLAAAQVAVESAGGVIRSGRISNSIEHPCELGRCNDR